MVPYVLWNATHDWPTLEFIQNAKRYKISDLSPLEFLSESVLEANPATVPLWLGGLAWLWLARRARRLRLIGLMFVLTFAILVIQKSKPYYLAASFPVLMAAGGAAWEDWTTGKRWRWARWVLAAVLLAGGVVFAPMAVPLLSPESLVAYHQKLGITPNTGEVGHTGAVPQYFSDRLGWEELARTVAETYQSLPAHERSRCVVLTSNYGQAGALEYWARRYELPPVSCRHNNYWLWGPPAGTVEVFIVVGFEGESLEDTFDEVVEAGAAETPFAQESRIRVRICRGLRRSLEEVWEESKQFI
jgi:hypothetical protein